MKKLATGLTLSAALGLSLFAAAPASALDRNGNFQNCDEVYAAGLSHIAPDHPKYDKGLDNTDEDLIGCENPENAGFYHTKRWGSETKSAPAPSKLPDHVTQPDVVDNKHAYPDCKDVFAAGMSNLKSSSKYYHKDLDADLDGIGCEYNEEFGVIVEGREKAAAQEIAAMKASAIKEEKAEEKQVAEVPAGAVDAGIAPESDPAAALGVGALGLAVVAGGAVVARRRAQV